MSERGGRSLAKRVARFGFPAFFLGFFLIAIGIRQGIQTLWIVGLVILGVVFLTAVARAVRNAWFPPRRPPIAADAGRSAPPPKVARGGGPGATHPDDV